MSDRELLELAAKAAGIKLDGMAMLPQRGWPINMESGYPWNPLTDDGDALRLAVNLRISIQFCFSIYGVMATAEGGYRPVSDGTEEDEDQAVATRRAIVRAAAEIGKAMP